MVIRTVQAVIFGVSMVMLLILGYGISFTRIGKALRAVAENPVVAGLTGTVGGDRFGRIGEHPRRRGGGMVIGLGGLPASRYSAYNEAVAFALLFVVLLVRPPGVAGADGESKSMSSFINKILQVEC